MPLVPTTKEVVMIKRQELSKEDIAHRAYELYVQRGAEPGKEVEDWVRAEKELSNEVVLGPVRTKGAQAGPNRPGRRI